MEEKKTLCVTDLLERVFRHSGKSAYDELPAKEVIEKLLEALRDAIESF